uniref:Uncharacterized protein n=1 Tax=Meloidogyne javanica TaxID=6303 RepID=A0A915LCL3_MELJA
MDDDAFGFGELAYDDNLPYQEDNQNKLGRQNDNIELTMTWNSLPLRLSLPVFLGVQTLDWHLNVGEDEVRTKRRKIEIENVLERVAQRILKARQENSKTSLNEGINIIKSKHIAQNS